MGKIKEIVERLFLGYEISYYICIFLMLVLLLGLSDAIYYSNHHNVTITVTNKERITQNNGNKINSYYYIYGENENGESVVLKIDDVWICGKFDSSDLYQQIRENKTYIFNVAGYRIKFLSQYPNIFSFQELEEK